MGFPPNTSNSSRREPRSQLDPQGVTEHRGCHSMLLQPQGLCSASVAPIHGNAEPPQVTAPPHSLVRRLIDCRQRLSDGQKLDRSALTPNTQIRNLKEQSKQEFPKITQLVSIPRGPGPQPWTPFHYPLHDSLISPLAWDDISSHLPQASETMFSI